VRFKQNIFSLDMRKQILTKVFFITLLGLSTLYMFSCDDFESDQQIPSYIYIKGFSMIENQDIDEGGTDGFLTNEVVDAWVYVDHIYIGTYALPCNVPILKKGKHLIEVRPGIKINGITLTRTEYPFYTTYTDTINLQPNHTDTINTISFNYKTSLATFGFTEFFETPTIDSLHADGLKDTAYITKVSKATAPDTVKYGSYCGVMRLASGASAYKVITDSLYCNNYSTLILEMDYWCNIPFSIGMKGKSSSSDQTQYIPAMTINANAKKGWQKIYVVLGKVWSQLYYPSYFQVYFSPLEQTSQANGWVFVDNLKIIHNPNK
jgi:hypothetical protein